MRKIILIIIVTSSSISAFASNNFLTKFNRIFSQNRHTFAICHEQAKDRNYNIKGSIDYQFSLLPTGKIDMIGVIEHLNIQDRTLVRCIYNKARKFKFPRTGMRKTVKVSKVFKI